MQACNLLSLATALPPYCVPQAEAKERARRAFSRKALFDRLAGVFDSAGIEQRYVVAEPGWYEQPHGWAERNAVYLKAAEDLFIAAALDALARAGLSAAEIDGVVTVSTTGIATPSLEARCAGRLGLRSDVRRVPVFGLGCAGGVSGLGLAARLAAAGPGSKWLFVCVETCSISIRLDSDDPAAVVATALFGDGAAAAVLSTEGPAIGRVVGSAETLWPDTLRVMGWDVEDPGLAVVFDRAIPPFVAEHLGRAVDDMLTRLAVGRDDLDRYCFHPGGVKVIEAVEAALNLPAGALDLEREVLRPHGNMSAPTVLFVLERLIARGLPGRVVAAAFGPGFTCSAMLVEAP